MTPAELEAIRARNAARTPGRWTWVDRDERYETMRSVVSDNGGEVCHFGNYTQYYPSEGIEPSEPDRSFIAHASTDIPALLSEVERLRRALEAAKRPHFVEEDNTDPDSFACRAIPPTLYDFPCNCGADRHNAAIDAALRGEA